MTSPLPPRFAEAAERVVAGLQRSPLLAVVRERLLPHAGKSLTLDIAGLRLGLLIAADGTVLPADTPTPDLAMQVSPDRLLRRAFGDAAAFDGLAFSGDAALAQTLGAIARDLQWDWPAVLESFLPPGVSAPLGVAAARVQAGWRETLARAETGLRDYAVNESGLVGRTEMQRFLRDVDELREAIDRLDARLQQLTARTA